MKRFTAISLIILVIALTGVAIFGTQVAIIAFDNAKLLPVDRWRQHPYPHWGFFISLCLGAIGVHLAESDED